MDKTSLKIKIQKYQKTLNSYITTLANNENDISKKHNVEHFAIIDLKNNHFQLIAMGWDDDEFIHVVLIHLSIHSQTGNIWIHQNYTEIEIDEELEKLVGIPKKHFVLGFHPKFVREHSDYAVA